MLHNCPYINFGQTTDLSKQGKTKCNEKIIIEERSDLNSVHEENKKLEADHQLVELGEAPMTNGPITNSIICLSPN